MRQIIIILVNIQLLIKQFQAKFKLLDMPPRANQKQKAKQQAQSSAAVQKEGRLASRGRRRSRSSDEENKEYPPSATGKRSARSKSRDNSKLDQSMKSAGKSNRNSDETVPAALQAQSELEIQQAFGSIVGEILGADADASAVTNVMKRTLVLLMRKSPALFQKTLLSFIERILTLEGEDAHIKNIHILLTRLFCELTKERDRQNGVKLVKSVLRFLLEILELPKLVQTLKQKTGHMLALVINATAETASAVKSEVTGENESPQQQLGKGKGQQTKATRVLRLLDESRADQELRQRLEEVVVEMLSCANSTTALQASGIQIAGFISDFADDRIFRQLMKLFVQSGSTPIREKIVRSFRVPYSAPALAFLGKRMRDVSPGIVAMIFERLTQNGVTLSQFPTAEARMLVLTEGFTSPEPSVREACIGFLKPTVQEYVERDDIAGMLKLIDARLAFGNQYFGRVPVFLVLAILEILDDDMTLANYLHSVVLRKLRLMAKIPLDKKKAPKRVSEDEEIDGFDLGVEQPDQEMASAEKQDEIEMRGGDPDKMDVDEVPESPITFEEILLLRLAFELNRSTKDRRSQYYIERLEEIMPEFEDYRKITWALASMPEKDLPVIDPRVGQIQPYAKGQVGFTRRAILGEWIKFSVQMDTQDAVIRGNLTSLCFELIGRIQYSFDDYEHLLRKRAQLLKGDEPGSIVQSIMQACHQDDEVDEAIEQLLENAYLNGAGAGQNAGENASGDNSVEITVRSFESIGTARSLQEYCKPYSMETLTLDYDDVCQIAVYVARTLLGDRVDEFQRTIMEAVSDIKEMVQDESRPNASAGDQGGAGMVFSQIGLTQQPIEASQVPSFGQIREKFLAKIDAKVDQIHGMGGDGEDVDLEGFNKAFTQLNAYVDIVEETHLKAKLSYKRALILCRSLLKQCRLANVHDHNVIDICDSVIHPAILNMSDRENLLIAFECVGLICILDKGVLLNYSRIFTEILEEELAPDRDNKREKVIAIKSVVDGLILHGIEDEKLAKFFELITVNYMTTKDRILRQVAIEGVCKMLFTPKLCDQNDQGKVEAILAQLIIQLFDHKYSPKNSLVTSILTEFFRNFAPFSEKRCMMLLNALTKVVYTAMREKYGVDYAAAKASKKKGKQQKKKNHGYDDSSDAEFEASPFDYNSDDSQFQEQKVSMREICGDLDLAKILGIMPTMLSRSYINKKAMDGFQLRKELSLIFFQRLLFMNKKLFGKTQIVKDVLLPVLDSVRLDTCDSLKQLKQVAAQWQKGNTLVLTTQRVTKFQHRLNERIHELEDVMEANEEIQTLPIGETIGNPDHDDVEMKQADQKRASQAGTDELEEDENVFDPDFDLKDLRRYWDEYVEDVIVDRGKYDDRELLAVQQIWLDTTASGLDTEGLIASAKKSILKSPSNFAARMGDSSSKKPEPARPRRGTRSQRNQQANRGGTAVATGRARGLQPIAEESFHSDKNPRRVRIVEEPKEKRPLRATKLSRGTVKSSVSEDEDSEYDSEDDEDSYSESGDEYSKSDFTNDARGAVPRKVAEQELLVKEEREDSSSMQQHENIVSDNLGYIAKNIAKSYAMGSKQRLSAGSDGSTNERRPGLNVIKLEGPSLQSKTKVGKDKDSKNTGNGATVDPSSSGSLRGSSRGKKAAPSKANMNVKKELIKDFDVKAEEERHSSAKAIAVKEERKQPVRSTRNRNRVQKSPSSAASRSEDSDDMYDFMDGTLTKQIKKNKRQAATAKQPAVRQQEMKKEPNLDDSKTSIKSSGSTTRMRTRQRKVQQ